MCCRNNIAIVLLAAIISLGAIGDVNGLGCFDCAYAVIDGIPTNDTVRENFRGVGLGFDESCGLANNDTAGIDGYAVACQDVENTTMSCMTLVLDQISKQNIPVQVVVRGCFPSSGSGILSQCNYMGLHELNDFLPDGDKSVAQRAIGIVKKIAVDITTPSVNVCFCENDKCNLKANLSSVPTSLGYLILTGFISTLSIPYF